jgi:two-component system, NtrC family, sensor kinase
MSHWSMRVKLAVAIGLFLILLQGLTSLLILSHEREFLIDLHSESAMASTRSFAIPVLDALLEEELHAGSSGTILAEAINNFMNSSDEVRYVAVLDNDNQVQAHNDLSLYGTNYKTVIYKGVRIFRDENLIIEASVPLTISTRSWGTLLIGFSADNIYNEISKLFNYLGLTTLVLILLTVFAVILISRHFTKQLDTIVTTVDSLDLDRLEKINFPECDGEAKILADRFSALQRRLIRSLSTTKSAEREVRHAEKLASVGRLAAGVAHEINNPLTGMQQCIETIRANPEDKETTRRYFDLIAEGLDRIEVIVKRLLEFSRKRPKGEVEVDFKKCVNRVSGLLEYRLKNNNVDIKETGSCSTVVAGDGQLLEEVCMNLMINACDAMLDGGELSIDYEHRNNFLLINFSDSGHGVASENLEMIFEPFFTTKDVGQGTGLGLSVTQSIVENHDGRISISNSKSGGAKFTVELPLFKENEK